MSNPAASPGLLASALTPAVPALTPAAHESEAGLQAPSAPADCAACTRHPAEGFGTLAMLLTMVLVGGSLAFLTEAADGARFFLMLAAGVTAALVTEAAFRRRARRRLPASE